MKMRRFAPAMLTIVLAASATAARAQQQIVIESQSTGGEPMMMPGLGGPRQMKTGTGRILGRVLASDSGDTAFGVPRCG